MVPFLGLAFSSGLGIHLSPPCVHGGCEAPVAVNKHQVQRSWCVARMVRKLALIPLISSLTRTNGIML